MRLDRLNIKIIKGKESLADQYIALPAKDRLSLVWEITEEVFSFTGAYDVKSRLQRNIIHIIRGKG